MNVVIIEDEHLTAERISTLLQQIDPEIQVLTVIDSVKRSVDWFQSNEKPDLVFMDIQLADGLSFDIFDAVDIEVPVIFITAFQEYAIKAFKVNSVDYLLKPVSEEALRDALAKYKRYFNQELAIPSIGGDLLKNIREMISKPYKSRFMVRVGEHIRSVDVGHILYFYSLQKGTYLHSSDKRNYVIDYTLGGLEDILDPNLFHRINRRYLITHGAIKDVITLSSSKLKVILQDSDDEEIYISRERVASFKDWLD
ncbi:MAG: LytTR family DNA-binding domain-containing protein [Bacteroidota bacterium]|nr:LytTR family DNA-binding domain-containing protein [Bacteroidota bacterium]